MPWYDLPKPQERQRVSDNIVHAFKNVDDNHDKLVSKQELHKLFKWIPGFEKWSEDDFSKLFENADFDRSGELSYQEFVDWILGIEIPQMYGARRKYPLYRSHEILYPSGVSVPLKDVENDLKDYTQYLNKERIHVAAKLRKFVKSREYSRALHRYFVEADLSGNGVLSWNDASLGFEGNEIFKFCLLCFERIGLPREGLGGDYMIHSLYHKFDGDKTKSLDKRECLCMMDSIIRAVARSQRNTDPDASSDSD